MASEYGGMLRRWRRNVEVHFKALLSTGLTLVRKAELFFYYSKGIFSNAQITCAFPTFLPLTTTKFVRVVLFLVRIFVRGKSTYLCPPRIDQATAKCCATGCATCPRPHVIELLLFGAAVRKSTHGTNRNCSQLIDLEKTTCVNSSVAFLLTVHLISLLFLRLFDSGRAQKEENMAWGKAKNSTTRRPAVRKAATGRARAPVKAKASTRKYGNRGGSGVSSSKSTGLYTRRGQKVYNAHAYSTTGAPTYNKVGIRVSSPTKYAGAVQRNSMTAAVKTAKALNPSAKAFSYVAHLPSGKKYVGMTRDPSARISAHYDGRGAKVTQELKPVAVTVEPHGSVAAAKRAETSTYFQLKNKSGGDRVRGAGHTKRFSMS